MNIRTNISTFLLAVSILSWIPHSPMFGQKGRKQSCAARINTVIKDSIFRQAFIGIKVLSLPSGKILYEYNADKLFRPASNVKLFTTAAGLALLGKNFQFKTEVYARGNLRDGILKGPLYLKGYGDPLLKTEHLDSLARKISEYGIRIIDGDIIGDVSYFDDLFWGKGWMWDDDPEYHIPYLSALSINGNTIDLTIISGTREGDSVQVLMTPQTSYCTLVNRARTSIEFSPSFGGKTSDTTLPNLKITRRWKERENTIVIEGNVPPSKKKMYTLNVWKPELYTLTLFKEKLLSYGISVRGVIKLDTLRNAIRLASISHSMDSIAVVVNKESFNLGAENIAKAIAAEKGRKPGSAETGLTLMKNYLSTIGVDTTSLVIADGSGKSRYNLVSPNTIIQLLTYQYSYPTKYDQFLRTLPIAGIDGTLKKRLADERTRGNVHAKTGTHDDATALSGYVITAEGNVLAFSILINHFTGDVAPFRKAQDRIVEILTNCK